MTRSEAGKLGAIKSLEIKKKKVLERKEHYKKEPSKCGFCGVEFPYEKRNLKFCGPSCSSSFHNPKRKKLSKCKSCGNEISAKKQFCDNSCQQTFQYESYVKKWKNGEETGVLGSGRAISTSSYIRRYLKEKYGDKCMKCGFDTKHPDGSSIIQLEHKDGDATNNSEENLELLCPNCHSLTETFGARNKVGRSKR